MVMTPLVSVALVGLLATGCAGASARASGLDPAASQPDLTPCVSSGGHVSFSETEATRYATPEDAVAAYNRWQARFDVRIYVPGDGYTVTRDEAGTAAVLRQHEVELDATKDSGGWRLSYVRQCKL